MHNNYSTSNEFLDDFYITYNYSNKLYNCISPIAMYTYICYVYFTPFYKGPVQVVL